MPEVPHSGEHHRQASFVRRGEPVPEPIPRTSLTVIPMFHVTACSAGLMGTMAGGSTTIFMRKWDAVKAMEIIEREKVNFTGGVPTIAWQLIEHPDRHKYDLSSIEAIAPAMGPQSAVLPLLNGVNHMTVLSGRFGAPRVLGGSCGIGVTLLPSGEIRHVGTMEWLNFGEVSGERTARCEALARIFAGTKINAPMPGKILSIKVSVGQAVKRGDVLMILEAMKMENEIQTPVDGKVAAIAVSEGANVNAGVALISIE